MRYHLSKKFAFKEYGDLKILFSKTGNPENEFYELSGSSKLLIEFIAKNNGVTQEEICQYLSQNVFDADISIRKDISDFLETLTVRKVLDIENEERCI